MAAGGREGRTEFAFTCWWSDWFHEDADVWRGDAWAVIKGVRT